MSIKSTYRRVVTEQKSFDSPVKTALFRIIQIIFRIFDKFFFDSCQIRASGLAFNTLLALVPLSALLFAFGGMSSALQEFLVDVLLPSSLNQILDALNIFTENAARLGTLGIIFFLVTTLMLLSNIENNLNAIWYCRRRRNFFQQLTVYTTVIIFASLLIGGNYSISGNILSFLPEYAEALNKPFLIKFWLRLSSITFISLTFLLLILLIPSVKVSFSSALTGALTGSVLWELAKWGFREWANMSVRNSVIYGSLFLIPLLLIWLYTAWLIVMVAMETAFVYHHRKEPHIRYIETSSLASTFSELLSVYQMISTLFDDNKGAVLSREIAPKLSIPEKTIEKHCEKLEKERLLLKTENGGYLPSSPPDKLHLSRLYSILGGMGDAMDPFVREFTEGGDRALKGKTVRDTRGKEI